MKIAVFLLSFALSAPVYGGLIECPSGSIRVHINELVPTQMEAGFAEVDKLHNNFLKNDAKGDPAKLATAFRDRFSTKPLPGFIALSATHADQQSYYITDNQHLAMMVKQSLDEGEINFDQAYACFKTVHDYSQITQWSKLVENLIVDKRVFLGAELTHQVQSHKISQDEAYKKLLSRNLAKSQFINNPRRSILGDIMKEDEITGRHFIDYIQFYLSDLINEKLTVELAKFDLDHLDKKEKETVKSIVRNEIYNNETVVDFLKNNYRRSENEVEDKKNQEETKVLIEKAVEKYNRNK